MDGEGNRAGIWCLLRCLLSFSCGEESPLRKGPGGLEPQKVSFVVGKTHHGAKICLGWSLVRERNVRLALNCLARLENNQRVVSGFNRQHRGVRNT